MSFHRTGLLDKHGRVCCTSGSRTSACIHANVSAALWEDAFLNFARAAGGDQMTSIQQEAALTGFEDRSCQPIASHEQALERVRALLPRIAACAKAVDSERRVPSDVIAALSQAGLFRIMAPRRYGGAELGFATLTEVTAEIASACGSTGWIYTVLAGHSWLLALFPQQAQEEAFTNPHDLTATVVRLGGERPKRVDGGYRIANASGRFCSGIDHAAWIILGAGVETAAGAIEPRYLMVPQSDVEVVDDWFTTGMRGTGSRSLRIAEAFVPEHRSVAIADLASGTAPGLKLHAANIYRAPFPHVLPLSLAGAPLGMARGAVNSFREKFRNRIANLGETEIAEHSAFFVRLADAAAAVDAAMALIVSDSRQIDHAANGTKTSRLDRARLMRDVANAAHMCRQAVNSLFEAGGGSGIYDGEDLQRIWRDINASTSHNTFSRERAGGMYARALFDLPPGKTERIGN